MVLFFILRPLLGRILDVDIIETRVGPDKVTYVYRTSGYFAREGVQKLKAKLTSLIVLPPARVPSEIKVNIEKPGILKKGFTIEMTVPREKFIER